MRPTPWRRARARATRPPGRIRRAALAADPRRAAHLARRFDPRRLRPAPPVEPAARPRPAGEADAVCDAPPTTIPLLPGEPTLGRRAAFALAGACTSASIALALGSMLLAVDGQLQAAAAALLGCVIADGIDGPLARRLGVASPFGAQMDSLADMCAFGVAGPVLMGAWLKGVVPDLAVYPVMALLAVCAAIRLARFNVSPKDGRYFSGVPTTLAAAVLALSVLLVPEPRFGALLIGGTLALFMVSGFPYPKLGQLAKLPVWIWLIPATGAWYDLRLTFLILVWTYLASGPLLWLHSLRVQEAAARR